ARVLDADFLLFTGSAFAAFAAFGVSVFAVSSPLAAAISFVASVLATASAPVSALDAPSLASAPTRLRFFSSLFLKSVSYQPAPFKRNRDADTSRRSCDLPHSGHLRKGASLIFCNASRSCPQALQRYS